MIALLLFAAAALGQPHIASNCRVTDGDTIRCGAERVRLNGIDAPELPGHCRRGRVCVAGDPYASSQGLAAFMDGPLEIRPLKIDRYGRTVAEVRSRYGDLSCLQLMHGFAIYVRKWDERGTTAAACPRVAR